MTETPAKCMSKLDWHAIVRCTLNFFRVMFLDKTPSHSWASRSPSPSSGRGLCPCFPKPAMTVWVRSAETDLVLLSTPMNRVTDNSGLTDCSIITRWQKKQRDDSVIYVLNCFSSLTDLHNPALMCQTSYKTWRVPQSADTVPWCSNSKPLALSGLMNEGSDWHEPIRPAATITVWHVSDL